MLRLLSVLQNLFSEFSLDNRNNKFCIIGEKEVRIVYEEKNFNRRR
mgnify:CR=1 FL=1